MLASLEETTKALGQVLWRFVTELCKSYATKELPTEEATRTRRKARKIAKGKGTKPSGSVGATSTFFNMCTYKLHALGDYVATIWRYGTTDNYSTQVVSNFT